MALSILDGNQSATTLSTILSSGQHITAHTVVSLGTQAITDIVNATSANLTNTQLRASAVTVGGTVTVDNSITIGSLPAISGTVTANGLTLGGTVSNVFPIGVGTLYSGVRAVSDVIGYRLPISLGDSQTVVSASIYDPLPAGTNRIGVVTIGAGTVTLGASTAQIGSVTASISGTVPISISSVTIGNSVTIGSLPAISGTVTANLSISSTAITSGSFTSLTSATLVPGNTARKMATVYNLGAGQLFVNTGATATTLGGGFMVALSSGDFYECDYTTTTLSAIFATAGTASWISH
jgi:hypothetical protein